MPIEKKTPLLGICGVIFEECTTYCAYKDTDQALLSGEGQDGNASWRSFIKVDPQSLSTNGVPIVISENVSKKGKPGTASNAKNFLATN